MGQIVQIDFAQGVRKEDLLVGATPGTILTPWEELKLPPVWDNTRLNTFQTCPRKGELSILRGLRPAAPARALDFGLAWHRFLEVWYRLHGRKIDSMVAPMKKFHDQLEPEEKALLNPNFVTDDDVRREVAKAAALAFLPPPTIFQAGDKRTHLLLSNMCDKYVEVYPYENFTIILVEASTDFTIPGGYNYHVLLDLVIEDEGKIRSMEHKSTGHLAGFGEEFNPNQQITGQIQGLLTICKTASYEAIINAALVPKRESQKVTEKDFTRFPNIFRTVEQLEEFELNASRSIQDVEEQFKNKFFRMNTQACNAYGGCPYKAICKQPTVADRELAAKEYFIVDPWDPLTRDKKKGEAASELEKLLDGESDDVHD